MRHNLLHIKKPKLMLARNKQADKPNHRVEKDSPTTNLQTYLYHKLRLACLDAPCHYVLFYRHPYVSLKMTNHGDKRATRSGTHSLLSSYVHLRAMTPPSEDLQTTFSDVFSEHSSKLSSETQFFKKHIARLSKGWWGNALA